MKADQKRRIFRVHHRRRYTVIASAALENTALSWKARGLLAYLLTRPDDWRMRFGHLENQAPDGVTALRSGVKELTKAGHLALVTLRDEGGRVVGKEYVVYEDPADNPEHGPADRGAGNRHLGADDGPTEMQVSHKTVNPQDGKPASLPSTEKAPSTESDLFGSSDADPREAPSPDAVEAEPVEAEPAHPEDTGLPFPADSRERSAAEYLYYRLLEFESPRVVQVEAVELEAPGAREEALQAWAKVFDLMVRRDGATWDEIRAVLHWLLDVDDWWVPQGNFQSATKLRDWTGTKPDRVRRWRVFLHKARNAKPRTHGTLRTQSDAARLASTLAVG